MHNAVKIICISRVGIFLHLYDLCKGNLAGYLIPKPAPAGGHIRVWFSVCECDVPLTQLAVLPTERRQLLLEEVVVLGGSRDEQQPPLGREPKRPSKQDIFLWELALLFKDRTIWFAFELLS